MIHIAWNIIETFIIWNRRRRVVVAFEVDFILFDLAACSNWNQPSSASFNI